MIIFLSLITFITFASAVVRLSIYYLAFISVHLSRIYLNTFISICTFIWFISPHPRSWWKWSWCSSRRADVCRTRPSPRQLGSTWPSMPAYWPPRGPSLPPTTTWPVTTTCRYPLVYFNAMHLLKLCIFSNLAVLSWWKIKFDWAT